MYNYQLSIHHSGVLYNPIVLDDITWLTDYQKSSGKLTFKALKDEKLNFQEGDVVSLIVNGNNTFYGYAFTKQRDKEKIINVTAYDQLRYLKNKESYVYTNTPANIVIKSVAADHNLILGTIEDTGYRIPSRVEKNEELLQIIQNALDLTLQNNKKMYVFYDDFGKLTLKSLENMKVDLIIDEETGENFDYSTSIDTDVYNRIKLVYADEKTGKKDIFIAQDPKHMKDWGVLQYTGRLQKNENGKAKADALLKLYNHKTRNLTIKNVRGDIRVRAGSLVMVRLNLGDISLKSWMMVKKCKHVFKESEHLMTLTMKGGEFIA